MRMSSAAVVVMLVPYAVSQAPSAQAAPAAKSGPKLEKGWVWLPFDPPVAKQIKPIVPPRKKTTSKRRKRSRKKRK